MFPFQMTQAGFQDGPPSNNLLNYWSSRKDWWRRQWHPTPVLLPGKSHGRRILLGCSPWGRHKVGHDWATSLSLSHIEGNGNHSSVLAWRIPGTGEPGRLPPMGSHRVGHDWSDLAAVAAERIEQRKWPYQRAILTADVPLSIWKTVMKTTALYVQYMNAYSIPGSSNSCERENLMDLAGLLTWANSGR